MRRRIPHYSLLVTFLLLALCSTVSAQDAVGPDSYPPGVNPLTGLPVDNPANLNRRPLIVKIDNYPPEVRPQSGVMQADIVWEHLLTGGATRFAAIYLGNDPDHVGPVRSSRLVDFELVRIYRALFAYSGMAQGEIDVLRTDPLVISRAVTGGCPALCRFPQPNLAYEHTLYGSSDALRQLADQLGRDTTPEPVYGMAFDPAAPASGIPLSQIRIDYRQTVVQWAYDPGSGRWLRSQDGQPHMDAVAQQQISAANLLVLEADHIEQPTVSPGYWGPGDFAFTVPMIGQGRVFLFRDGTYTEGVWKRATRSDPLTYYDLNGSVLQFKPGNTWVNLVPRWTNGFELTFVLDHPITGTINAPRGANLRTGPAEGYTSIGAAPNGIAVTAVGRNSDGSWVQLLQPDGSTLWASITVLNLDGDVMTLPWSRSSYER